MKILSILFASMLSTLATTVPINFDNSTGNVTNTGTLVVNFPAGKLSIGGVAPLLQGSVTGSLTITGTLGAIINAPWSVVSGTPTTISGYGITDGVTLTGTQALTNKTVNGLTISPTTGTLTIGSGVTVTATTSGTVIMISTLTSTLANYAALASPALTGSATLNGAAILTSTADGTLTITGSVVGSGSPDGTISLSFSGGTTGTGTVVLSSGSTMANLTLTGTTTMTGTQTASLFLTALPVANVKAYGAKGDGSTDDTTAVNAACAAGEGVYFPPGTYIISNLTSLRQGNLLFSDGPSSAILKMKSGATGWMLYGNGFSYGVENITSYGGNNSSYTTTSSQGSQSFAHFDTTAIGNICSGNYIYGFNNMAVGINGNSASFIPGMNVTNNTIINNWCAVETGPSGTNRTVVPSTGTSTLGSEYSTVAHNIIIGSYYGVVIDAGNDLISDNTVTSCGSSFYVNNPSNPAHGVITGNLANHSTNALVLNNIGSEEISGNIFILSGGGSSGIAITNSSAHIHDNTFYGGGVMTLSNNATNYLVFTNNIWTGGVPTIINNTTTPYLPSQLSFSHDEINNIAGGYVNFTSPLLVDSSNCGYTTGFTTTGSNLVSNGTFSVTGTWTIGSAWTIAGNGYASASGSSGFFYQGITTTNNLYYAVTYTITNYVSGSVNCGIGFAQGGTSQPHSANGTYTDIIPSTQGSNLVFYSGSFNGRVTGVTAFAGSLSPGTLTTGAFSGNLTGGVSSTYPVAPFVGEKHFANLSSTGTLTLDGTITSPGVVSLSTATPSNVVSLNLTAGHWLINFNANTSAASTTTTLAGPMIAGSNTTTATLPADGTEGYSNVVLTVGTATNTIPCAAKEITLTGSGTVYGIEQATFTAGTISGFGSLHAIRLP